MSFDPERAEIRFGCGLSPKMQAVQSVEDQLAHLRGPDQAAQRFPIPGFDEFLPRSVQALEARRARRTAGTDAEFNVADKAVRDLNRQTRLDSEKWFGQALLRRALTTDGLRERLVAFWADHFTVVGKGGLLLFAHEPYVEDAIRPHVAGRFSDMLQAVITHPAMLQYLDQSRSIGPGSRTALKSAGKKGLNENLARELLELHTLGVEGPYTQHDVRELAKLLTGLSFTFKDGFLFRPQYSEPGSQKVLGRVYGESQEKLDSILTFLDDLARHPATAVHLARKLAVHFVADAPDQGLIDHMAARFVETEGNLLSVCEAMLEHPAAWEPSRSNVKRPVDFMGSALRALGIEPAHMPMTKPGKIRVRFSTPLALMGQRRGRALGPDGWPEDDADWITPQRLAARLQWAMSAPFLVRRVLPDPREFVDMALGRDAPESVRFAAAAAETRAEGVGLVLASPAFQRM